MNLFGLATPESVNMKKLGLKLHDLITAACCLLHQQ